MIITKEFLLSMAEYLWRAVYPWLEGAPSDEVEFVAAVDSYLLQQIDRTRGRLGFEDMVIGKATETPDGMFELLSLYRWSESTYANYHLDEKLAAALLVTAASPEAVALAKPPFDGLLIDVPPGLIPLIDVLDPSKTDDVRFILVAKVARPSVPQGWVWTFRAYASRGSAIFRYGIQSADMVTPISETELEQTAVFSSTVEDLDQRAATLVGRLVINLCLAISDPTKVQQKGGGHEWWKTRAAPEKRIRSSGQPRVRLFRVSTPVKGDFRPVVQAFARGERASPLMQSLVSGHYRAQRWGPGRAQTKVIWIEPYWRGPEDAPIAFRPHKMNPIDPTDDLHRRIAAVLEWSTSDVQSMSLPALRDLVRTVDPALAAEITERIRSGRIILGRSS